MEQRRLLLFFVSAMAILFVWMKLIAPVLAPPQPVAQQQQNQADDQKPQGEELAPQPEDQPLQAEKPAPAGDVKPTEIAGDQKPAEEQTPEQKPAEEKPEPEPQLAADWNPDSIPHRTVTLGSVDASTGYFMEVDLTSQGAGVLELRLSDPRFVHLDNQNQPLELIRSVDILPPTLGTVFYAEQHKVNGLEDQAGLIEWQVATDAKGQELIVADPQHPGINRAVTFRGVFSDLGIEVRKTFTVTPSDKQTEEELQVARRTDPAGYQLELEVEIRNLSSKPQAVLYHLQGPIGVPLEGQENRRTFKQRQIAVGFLDADGSVDDEVLTASNLIDKVDDEKAEEWSRAIRYIGVDVKYFASLLVPENNQLEDQTFASAFPMIVERNADDEKFSDISVVLQSRKFSLLPAGGQLPDGQPGDVTSHKIKLFAGPKREALLTGMEADSILDYGRFGILAGVMLAILNWLRWLGLPYGIAIVVLTLMVRGCIYPLSRKQAIGAKKMKELQPKLNEIKKKHAKDKEKQARAQMELFRKHNYNPLAGCLPLLLQFPIFISLYTALSSSVDLRLASFLWIDNLAAPDHLFTLPFSLPMLGNQFNLLPILTIFLFIAQQRLFIPPAQTEEQEMQYKMMNVMMIVMGFLFYQVPAGLCIYFITSSLWGMTERKMLDIGKPAEDQQPVAETSKVKA